MRTKNPLLLVAFTLVLVVLVVGITGLALAAPKPLDNHQATPVEGTLTTGDEWGVDFWINFENGVPDGDNTVYAGNWVDLPGKRRPAGHLSRGYHHHIRKRHSPITALKARPLSPGTVMGRRTSWVASLQGSGDMDPGMEFAGTPDMELDHHQLHQSPFAHAGEHPFR